MGDESFARCTNRVQWVIQTNLRSLDYACAEHLAQLAIGPHVESHRPAGPGEMEGQCSACVFPDEQAQSVPENDSVAQMINLTDEDPIFYECGCFEETIKGDHLVQRVTFCDEHIHDDEVRARRTATMGHRFRALVGSLISIPVDAVFTVDDEQIQIVSKINSVVSAESEKTPPAATL